MYRRSILLLEDELTNRFLQMVVMKSAAVVITFLWLIVLWNWPVLSVLGTSSSWLVRSIEAMTAWLKAVRLEGGVAPRFNDSAVDSSPLLMRLFLLLKVFYNSARVVQI